MDSVPGEKTIYEFFWWSVLGKGLISLAEVLVGLVVFFVPVSVFTNFVIHVAQSELSEEPGNFIASHVLSLTQSLPVGSQLFIAIYIFSRGVIKLGLVWALLRNQLWAYPWSLVVLGLFVLYQLYQIAVSHSILILLLTVFDLVVMYFIWREYKIVERHLYAH